jgi:hypothetical protein
MTHSTMRIVEGVRVLFALLACLPAAAVGQPAVVIRNVTVIPMTGAAPSPRQSVIVRGGRIAEIGPSARLVGLAVSSWRGEVSLRRIRNRARVEPLSEFSVTMDGFTLCHEKRRAA